MQQPARGVFVVVHGLNQRPSAMDSLSTYLSSLGYNTLRVSLEGHDVAGDEAFPAEHWVQNVASAAHEAKARYPRLPLYILGYSMGGLLTVRAVEEDPSLAPSKVILLAPALGLHPIVLAARVLTLFPPLTIRTPNLAPAKYRRFETTPLFWYSNVAELYDQARDPAEASRLRGLPALVILNPADELISQDAVEEWIQENQLGETWRVELFRPQARDPEMREHLIIDEPSLGEAEWRRMKESLRDFLL